jgi:hypothetical protein
VTLAVKPRQRHRDARYSRLNECRLKRNEVFQIDIAVRLEIERAAPCAIGGGPRPHHAVGPMAEIIQVYGATSIEVTVTREKAAFSAR